MDQLIYPRAYMVNARLKKDLSMRKVAALCGLTHQHYSRIESGKSKGRISFKVMGLIAEALEIPISDFFLLEMDYLKKSNRQWLQTPKHSSR